MSPNLENLRQGRACLQPAGLWSLPLAPRGEGPAPSAPVGSGVGWGLLENPCPGFSGWVSRAVPPARWQAAPSGPERYGQLLLAAGPCPARARRSRPPAPVRWPPALQWTLLPISGRGEGCPGCGVTSQEGLPGSRKLGTSDTSCSSDLVTHGLCCRGLELRGQWRRVGPAGGQQMLSPAGAGLGPRPGGSTGSWSGPARPPHRVAHPPFPWAPAPGLPLGEVSHGQWPRWGQRTWAPGPGGPRAGPAPQPQPRRQLRACKGTRHVVPYWSPALYRDAAPSPGTGRGSHAPPAGSAPSRPAAGGQSSPVAPGLITGR